MNYISIVTPSRDRAAKAKGYIQSIQDTAEFPERVEVLLYVDDDDPQLKAYRAIMEHPWTLMRVHIEVGPSLFGDIGSMWNAVAKLAMGNILYAGNDDLMHITKGWDVVVDREVANYPDDIYCLWFNDNINGEKHCAFPLVSRKWYEALGYLYPTGFKYCYPDTWVFDIGKKVGRCRYVGDVMVEHQWMGRHQDETYRRSRRQGEGDAQSFAARDPERVIEAEKIRRIMQ